MDFYIGQIAIYGFNCAAAGVLQRNLIPITQNTALFSLLGTTYGGNGQTTFALPDLRSRAALHAHLPEPIIRRRETGGEENVTLGIVEMHVHTPSLWCEIYIER